MELKMSTLMLIAFTIGSGMLLTARSQTNRKPKKALLRIGVYDPRAIAAVFTHIGNRNKTLEAKLPEIARQSGVDVIVSKWEFDYQSPAAEMVDITDSLVAALDPGQRVLGIVKEMKDTTSLSEEEILAHPD